MRSYLSIVGLNFWVNGVLLSESTPVSGRVLSMTSSGLTASGFTLRS